MKFGSDKNEKESMNLSGIDKFEVPMEEIDITIKQASGLGYSVLLEPQEINSFYVSDGVFDRASETFTVYLLKKVAE
ncbi:hypothetical protein C7H83_10195 [Tetragenococcus halophilus]|uniref:Uncharacterized protein n=1 Tax=Tetragenococcus halophilus TaxID=51669 RepID=A0A3G5FKL2_TETHA|nr:hypothetical protein [Tetragenococcus halophilus]AYW50811.1 hypothetical protein C7H83_10195 [Tetragenococcus halophilus]GBD64894.1 putative uncharacterized protein [Tetragenococcus halophilus subsp. flandriensis]GMA08916.1 hypothetical protein GCM10025886_20670 [Tetragenococcus halophilus subsp. flandriensis]